MRETTIAELGPNFPIGFPDDNGKLIKPFTLRPYKARIDRHLGHWREANEGRSITYLVAKLMSMVVSQAGPHQLPLDKDGDSTAEGELGVSQWFFSDVMYAYVWARIKSLDPFLWLPVKCPVCPFSAPRVKFDLRTCTVFVAESLEDMRREVTLRDGFPLRGGKETVKAVTLQPVKWAALYDDGAIGTAITSSSYVQLQSAIRAINGSDNPYTPLVEELDEASRVDMLLMDRGSNIVSAGLDLETSITCPGVKDEECGFDITEKLDWSFDSFFDSSFQLEN